MGVWRVSVLVMAGLFAGPVLAERYAVLVGVSHYRHCDDPRYQRQGTRCKLNLQGPRNDVEVLRQLLTGKWGFSPDKVVALTDADATRGNILKVLGAVAERSRPGDHVFFYFSGHGTSSRQPGNPIPLPHTSGALLPTDFPATGSLEAKLNNLIIGRRDLKPIFTRMDRGGRHVFVVVDACYSGNAVRGLYRSLAELPSFEPRYVSLSSNPFPETRGAVAPPDPCGFRCGTREVSAYPYRNVFFMAAASEDETAADISGGTLQYFPTLDGKAHGAFSDAFLRVLAGDLAADVDGNGSVSYSEAKKAVSRFMAGRNYPHTPQALPTLTEDSQLLAGNPLFGSAGQPGISTGGPLLASGPVKVRLMASFPELQEQLSDMTGVAMVDGVPDIAVTRDRNGTLLFNGAGDLIVRLRGFEPQGVVQRVEAEVRARRLLSLGGRDDFELSLGLTEGTRGTTAVEGETVGFVVRSQRSAHILLVVFDASGAAHVLYPYTRDEMRPVEANRTAVLPGPGAEQQIRVTPPFGTDRVVAIGFDRPVPALSVLMGKEIVPGSRESRALEQALASREAGVGRDSIALLSVPGAAP